MDLLAIWQIQIINSVFQRHDPSVEQLVDLDALAAKVVDDERAAIALQLDGRFADSGLPFQDDVFIGSRIALNDVQDTQILIGAITDLHSDATFFNLEASRRLASDWKISIKARAFTGVPDNDLLASFRKDDYAQIELTRYFN